MNKNFRFHEDAKIRQSDQMFLLFYIIQLMKVDGMCRRKTSSVIFSIDLDPTALLYSAFARH